MMLKKGIEMKKVFAVVVAICWMGSAVRAGEQVENPAYSSWAGHKVGTTVIYKETMQISMAGMAKPLQVKTVITWVLKEIKPEAVTVEVTKEATANGGPAGSMSWPATVRVIAAKIEKEGVDVPEEVAGQPIKDVKTGKETVEIGGKKYEASTLEFTHTGSGGMGPNKTEVKVWSSAEVPGRMLKMECQGEQPDPSGMKVSRVLVEVKEK